MTYSVRILIADDDQEDLELIEEAILDADPDAVVHKVSNGKAAIEYLDDLQDGDLPQLIVLDYNMPELNGAEALSIIGQQDRLKEIPRIVLSTSSAALYMHESKKNGAQEYFVKPDTKSGLEALAKKMLALCA
jgi:CheY-like chemotaxis protein